jgi:hypothetical protein
MIPQIPILSNLNLNRRCFSFHQTKNRHFDRSGSRLYERRSGEIRVAALTLATPLPGLT